MSSVALAAIVIAGVALRIHFIATDPFRIDEGESCINALTILNHGLPTSQYMGLPIFENTLITTWPEHDEYEFKDSSYSDRGLAVYHGWLPLYSIAAGLKLFGIEPDQPIEPPTVRHDKHEFLIRKIAPRVPAVIFSACFMVLMFVAGRSLGGVKVGWITLALVAFVENSIKTGGQARYYSATAMFSAACSLLLWKAIHQGRWRDFSLLGVVLVLQFHTHSLSCLVLCCLFGLMTPTIIRRPVGLWKLLMSGLIFALGVIPWILFTGYLDQITEMPKALPLMSFPSDLWDYFRDNLVLALPPIAAALWLLIALFGGKRLPDPIVDPIIKRRFAIIFLVLWTALGFVGFIVLIPAVSYFTTRLSLTIAVPSTLLAALVFSSITQIIAFRVPPFLSYSLGFIYFFLAGQVYVPNFKELRTSLDKKGKLQSLIGYLADQKFKPGTRMYAHPNFHMTYMYFTGLPIQNLAPVRKSFLDNYPHDIVIITSMNIPHIEREDMKAFAPKGSLDTLTQIELDGLRKKLMIHLFYDVDLQRTAVVEPQPQPLPTDLESVLANLRAERDIRQKKHIAKWAKLPLLRGFDIRTYEDWWQIFFYRFSDAEQRSGLKVNYAKRIKGSRAELIFDAYLVAYHTSGTEKQEETP